jgi:hypothetical protein
MKDKLISWFYYGIGIVFLLLAKIKNKISEYTPKTFSKGALLQCVEYDLSIVEGWMDALSEYTHREASEAIKGKAVLELGPGSDLGAGLALLHKGAAGYAAVDVYDIAAHTPAAFYDVFFNRMERKGVDTTPLKEELAKTQNGRSESLNFIHQKDFDIPAALGTKKIDLFFSNAAFEHFDNVYETIKGVTSVASDEALFLISVDLKTHSRWIRDNDPNNIYRYPRWLYKALSSKATPNRIRPNQYVKILQEFGWGNIVVKADTVVGSDQSHTLRHLHKSFQDPACRMDYLTISIYATKK